MANLRRALLSSKPSMGTSLLRLLRRRARAAAVAKLERRGGEAEGRRQHALAGVGAVDLARGGDVLLADELLVPPNHPVDERRLDADHPRDVDEGAQPERQVGLWREERGVWMGSVGCAPPAVSETRRRRASKNLCLSVGTTPPSTFVYGILCCENALFVSTDVTQSYL